MTKLSGSALWSSEVETTADASGMAGTGADRRPQACCGKSMLTCPCSWGCTHAVHGCAIGACCVSADGAALDTVLSTFPWHSWSTSTLCLVKKIHPPLHHVSTTIQPSPVSSSEAKQRLLYPASGHRTPTNNKQSKAKESHPKVQIKASVVTNKEASGAATVATPHEIARCREPPYTQVACTTAQS